MPEQSKKQLIIFYSDADTDVSDSIVNYFHEIQENNPIKFQDIINKQQEIEIDNCIFLSIISPKSDDIDIYASFITARRLEIPLLPLLVDVERERYNAIYGEFSAKCPANLVKTAQQLAIPRNLHALKQIIDGITLPRKGDRVTRAIPSTPHIFISAKNYDYPVAKEIYDYLKLKQYDVFLAPSILDKMEHANYAKMIDRELEKSTHMLLIISNPQDISTGWVEYEWFTFHFEMTSGRKTDGNLHIIAVNRYFNETELPIRIRPIQQTIFNPSDLSIIDYKIGKKDEIPKTLPSPPSPFQQREEKIQERINQPIQKSDIHQSPPDTPPLIQPYKGTINQPSQTQPPPEIPPVIPQNGGRFNSKYLIILVILVGLIIAAIIIFLPPTPLAPPSHAEIVFTQIPAWGTGDLLYGKVVNMSPAEHATHKIGIYIYVNGWWGPKPYATDVVNIRPDGTWQANIVTGGYDKDATKIAAILVPSSVSIPYITGVDIFPPAELQSYPITYANR